MRVESQGEAHRGQSLRQLIHNATASLGPVQPADPRLPRLPISSTPLPPPPPPLPRIILRPWPLAPSRPTSGRTAVTEAAPLVLWQMPPPVGTPLLQPFHHILLRQAFFLFLFLSPTKLCGSTVFLFCFCFACCGWLYQRTGLHRRFITGDYRSTIPGSVTMQTPQESKLQPLKERRQLIHLTLV